MNHLFLCTEGKGQTLLTEFKWFSLESTGSLVLLLLFRAYHMAMNDLPPPFLWLGCCKWGAGLNILNTMCIIGNLTDLRKPLDLISSSFSSNNSLLISYFSLHVQAKMMVFKASISGSSSAHLIKIKWHKSR